MCVQAERSDSIRRTLQTLQNNLPQEPQESEQLLVRVLQRSLSSQSTPISTPIRKSVIERTPPHSPIHHLSPRDPLNTPSRRSTDDSVFLYPTAEIESLERRSTPLITINNASSGQLGTLSSKIVISGESNKSSLSSVAPFSVRNSAAEGGRPATKIAY